MFFFGHAEGVLLARQKTRKILSMESRVLEDKSFLLLLFKKEVLSCLPAVAVSMLVTQETAKGG